MPKYSKTLFDQAALIEFDQKDKLFKMMRESKSYNKHHAHKALFDALALSLSIDEDDIDKQLKEQCTSKKRGRDDQDQDPPADSEKEKKKRKEKDSKCSKKDKDQVGSSKKGKSPSKSSKTDKFVHANETIHDVEMKIGESVEDYVVDAEDPTQADASAPKQDKPTWFKTVVVERHESPDLEWHKESTVDDAPEQSWSNEMVNAEKNQRTFNDVIDQLDWMNPEGDKFPHDFSKPLPLHGAPGRLTIPIDFFFNKDLKYLTTVNVEKNYVTSLTKTKAARYDLEGIEETIPQLCSYQVDKQFGYGYLKEIIVRRANQKECIFKESNFPRLYLNDIKDKYLLYAQNKLHHLIGDEQTDLTGKWNVYRSAKSPLKLVSRFLDHPDIATLNDLFV
ncbi:hypothetical protein Tco_0238151 [Tanacetum coccineum]